MNNKNVSKARHFQIHRFVFKVFSDSQRLFCLRLKTNVPLFSFSPSKWLLLHLLEGERNRLLRLAIVHSDSVNSNVFSFFHLLAFTSRWRPLITWKPKPRYKWWMSYASDVTATQRELLCADRLPWWQLMGSIKNLTFWPKSSEAALGIWDGRELDCLLNLGCWTPNVGAYSFQWKPL